MGHGSMYNEYYSAKMPSKPRTCPQCAALIGLEGIIFSPKGDLICNKCNKVAFPVTVASEVEVEVIVKKKYTVRNNPYSGVPCSPLDTPRPSNFHKHYDMYD